MFDYNQDSKHRGMGRIFLWKSLRIICLVVLLVFAFTHEALVERLEQGYPTAAFLLMWLVGMLSYHQDARHRDPWWSILSQTLSIACLIAILAFGIIYRQWLNFLIALPLAWLHLQFTKRWWTRPGAWW